MGTYPEQNIYQSTLLKIPGRAYGDIVRTARKIHKSIEQATKRTPYIKSAYFDNSKVFIDVYWAHLNQKPRHDRKRRLKFYELAIDLIKHSKVEPTVQQNPNEKKETVYRFTGLTKMGELYYVQIKEDARGRKYFMSAFSPK